MMENEFDRIVRDAKFAYDLMEQNREMERFVNESLILASGNKQAINEMAIIHEAAAGDKIKSFFEKIKNFFKKIFDKLGASMSALFKEQKEYIDKYANIIGKCKWNVGDGNGIYDIFKGVPRIISAVDAGDQAIFGKNMDLYFKGDSNIDKSLFLNTDDFKSKEAITSATARIKQNQTDANEARATAFKEFTSQGYWAGLDGFASFIQNDSNGNANPNDTFKAWFQGSVDTVSYSGDDIENNFQTCINVCYGGQSYINKLEKIVTTVNKKMDEAQKTMENYHKEQKAKILEYAKKDGGNERKNTEEIVATKGTEDGKFTVNSGDIHNEWYNDQANKADTAKLTNKSIEELNTYLNSLCGNKVIIKVKAPDENKNDNKDQNKTKKFSELATTPDPSKPNDWKLTIPDGTDPNKTKTVNYNGDKNGAMQQLKTHWNGYTILDESFNIYRDFRNYFNEDFTAKNSSSSDSKTSYTGASSNQINSAGETNTKLSNTTVNKMNVDSNITVQGGTAKEAEELLNLDIRNREIAINSNVNISTTIASTMFNAFKYINKESFNIIKAHVQWYLSNPGAENDSANQTTRTRDLNMNAAQPAVTSNNTSTNTSGNNGG